MSEKKRNNCTLPKVYKHSAKSDHANEQIKKIVSVISTFIEMAFVCDAEINIS